MKIVGVVANPSKKNSLEVTKKFLPLLAKRSCKILLEPWLAESIGETSLKAERSEILSQSDWIIVLGGDGTLLATARDLDGRATPLLGVNLGSLGFLTEVSSEALPSFIQDIWDKKYRVETRVTLEASVSRAGKLIFKGRALNEMVLSKGTLSRLIHLDVMVGLGHRTHFVADGLIVATPTGSTAHSLSAGGPIVHPNLQAFVLTPICPQTLTSRPLIIPMDMELLITMKSEQEQMMLTLDGQQGSVLIANDEIKVVQSKKPVHLLMSPSTDYFDVLHKKLQWGGKR